MICKKCGREYEDDMSSCLWCNAPNEEQPNFKKSQPVEGSPQKEIVSPETTEGSNNRVAGLFMWSCMIFNFTGFGYIYVSIIHTLLHYKELHKGKVNASIKDNKIYTPLKDKWLVNKPEEEVRQKYICRLVDSYGYSLDQMDQEKTVNNSQRGTGSARADIVVWRDKEGKSANPQKSPIIIVECKAESVTIHEEDYFQG